MSSAWPVRRAPRSAGSHGLEAPARRQSWIGPGAGSPITPSTGGPWVAVERQSERVAKGLARSREETTEAAGAAAAAETAIANARTAHARAGQSRLRMTLPTFWRGTRRKPSCGAVGGQALVRVEHRLHRLGQFIIALAAHVEAVVEQPVDVGDGVDVDIGQVRAPGAFGG